MAEITEQALAWAAEVASYGDAAPSSQYLTAILVEIASLRSRLESAERDTERLNFIERGRFDLSIWMVGEGNVDCWQAYTTDAEPLPPNGCEYHSVREAIDAAISEVSNG